MGIFQEALRDAKALTLQGRLMEATREIQRGLGVEVATEAPPVAGSSGDERGVAGTWKTGSFKTPGADAVVEDVAFREVLKPATPPAPVVEPAAWVPPAPGADFDLKSFVFGAQHYGYRLFIPSHRGTAALPLLVMLHGCKQDALDFSAGTAMNALAERDQFMVLYPQQIKKANSMGCWNWFEPAHQQRSMGEPGMIAALVTHIVQSHNGDGQRVYIAGLSAGGAMAALVGKLHPEVFSAVAVHSGLPPGAARDLPTALAAMRSGPGKTANVQAIGLPTLVIQGSADKTVASANANRMAQEEVAHWARQGVALSLQKFDSQAPGTRGATVSRWSDQQGKPRVEVWSIASAPHAWAGGNASGSFTDPKGPSASEAVVRFFRLGGSAA